MQKIKTTKYHLESYPEPSGFVSIKSSFRSSNLVMNNKGHAVSGYFLRSFPP